jgi:hypothetical protein
MIHSINFTDYTANIDFNDYKNTIKQILSDMDKKSLIEYIWDNVDWNLLDADFEEELREAYPPPDDEDPDDELRRYYDRVRM